MREFLEDAHEHRTDGYGRAQAHVKQQLPKRFYKETGAKPVDGGFAVTLDGKATLTPGRKPMVVPSAAIATAMAEEWAAQQEFIDPLSMPMVRLVNSAVESGEDSVAALRAEVVKYAGNDLLLYRMDTPTSLAQRQEELWDAVLVKLARHFTLVFQPTLGITHQPQPAATIQRIAETLEIENLFVLTAMNAITSISGSGLLALAIWHQLINPEEAWIAAHVDEDHNISQWGEVEEITVRRAKRRAEFDAAVRLLDMLRI